jgi:uncharacterized membrane protein (DUF106 family)
MLDGFFNAIFGWSINIDPLFGMFIITLVITVLITVAYKYLTDQHVMKSLKEEVKKMQKDVRKNKGNSEKMMAIQKEMMSKNMKMMKMNFKPMLITLLPILVLFGWMRAVYDPMGGILFGLSWLWTYIIFTLILSFVLRKIFKVN